MLDIDTINTINEEEKKITQEGAYANGGLVGELKKSLEELHQPFSGMLSKDVW